MKTIVNNPKKPSKHGFEWGFNWSMRSSHSKDLTWLKYQ